VGVAPSTVQAERRARLGTWLGDAEMKVMASLAHAARPDWFAGRMALKLAALAGRWPCDGEAALWPVSHRRDGEPYLTARPEIRCSIAHSGGAGLAAVAPMRVGVDIERSDALTSHRAETFASLSDLAALRPFHAPTTVAWAAKEAVLKATGKGLTTSPRSVTLRQRANRLSAQVGERDGASVSEWTVFLYPHRKWAIVLALEGPWRQRPVLRWYQRAGLSPPGATVVVGADAQGGAPPLIGANAARLRI